MTRTMLNRRADSDIGHGRVFMSSCVYEFTLGERAFQNFRNKKARLSNADGRA
jgi:hypothetical protein